MDKINDGGSAFPMIDYGRANSGELIQYSVGGMTLRDWFAGQAMAARAGMAWGDESRVMETARRAYILADAMLAARGGGEDA